MTPRRSLERTTYAHKGTPVPRGMSNANPADSPTPLIRPWRGRSFFSGISASESCVETRNTRKLSRRPAAKNQRRTGHTGRTGRTRRTGDRSGGAQVWQWCGLGGGAADAGVAQAWRRREARGDGHPLPVAPPTPSSPSSLSGPSSPSGLICPTPSGPSRRTAAPQPGPGVAGSTAEAQPT